MAVGMNDVLPKPFTKEGLLQMLEHQLAHLTRPKGGQQPQQQQQPQQPPQGQISHGSIPTQLNFNNPQHGMHHDQQLPDPPNTGDGLKYSVSPAPSKSPGTAGMYSTGRSPTDMAEDVTQQVQPQGMEEPGGGYMGMMGGYMPEDTSAHGHSYQSPAQGQRRLADDDMYGPIKKQQRY